MRVRKATPVPQVREQGPQPLHAPQPPSCGLCRTGDSPPPPPPPPSGCWLIDAQNPWRHHWRGRGLGGRGVGERGGEGDGKEMEREGEGKDKKERRGVDK